jgi:uncharacterized RDD family membrane protein YckC
MQEEIDPETMRMAARPGLLRRLAAIFYDCWLVAALWLIGAFADLAIRRALGLGTDGAHPLLQIYLVAAPLLFYGWFWTHGGQTLGMRAWRLKLVARDGKPADWRKSLLRFGGAVLSAAALGLGYLWILLDPERLAWHDRLSGTRLVMPTR